VWRTQGAEHSAAESAWLTLQSVQLSGLMQQARSTPQDQVAVGIEAPAAVRDPASWRGL